jgi:hypothetical protein
MNSLTANSIKWNDRDFRKTYNKAYYNERVKKDIPKVCCELCERYVSINRLAKHQLTQLCKSNAIYEYQDDGV